MFVDEKKQGEVAIDPVLDILIKARERVERGWCQNSFQLGDRVCAIGAIIPDLLSKLYNPFCVIEFSEEVGLAIKYLGEAVGAHKQECAQYLIDLWWEAVGAEDSFGIQIQMWNDAIGRTKADIIAGFDKAIALRQKSA